jgi:DeoR/GlpR family transcriptional regulator of sugar metabolism
MTTRQQTILDTLEKQSATTFSLALLTDAPEATVRRNIQRLRDLGHNIVYRNGRASIKRTFDDIVDPAF